MKFEEKFIDRNIAELCEEYDKIKGSNQNLARIAPDLIDGLKPVQRRALFIMFDKDGGRTFRKLATISGDVFGRVHPHCLHGDTMFILTDGPRKTIKELYESDQSNFEVLAYDEKTNDNIKLVVDEAKRLSNLVNDLLDLSKAELGKLDLNKETVDLNDFLTSVYNQYRIYLENQNIKFDLELDEDIECELDDPRMRQVLYNFINNAMNYNDKEDPYIRLSTKKDGDTVTISVYDNGKGISPEDVDKIWDRYYKVDKEHKRQLIGSGIGLSLAKMILEAHGLEYGVESSLGEYSRFYFKIRAHKEVQA